MNSSPARRASSGRGAAIVGKFGGDDDAQAVGNHDQQLVAAGMAKAVVDDLEAVEVDEQHRRLRASGHLAQQLVGFGAEMEAVGQGRDRIVHAQRMGILDRRADLGEQAVDRGRQLGHVFATIGGAGLVSRRSSTASSRSPSAVKARALSLFGRSEAM